MKKIFFTVLISITMLVGCNRQIMDTTYFYDYAIIKLPNGEVVEGVVQSWMDYEDGDQIQVEIDGTMYLVHSSNIVLTYGYKVEN